MVLSRVPYIRRENWKLLMQPVVLHDLLGRYSVDKCLDEIGTLKLERYNNPFERKSFLADKDQLDNCPTLRYAFVELRHTTLWVERLLDLRLSRADARHFGGLFVYEQGDYLEPHVDAGLHPKTGERKVATAVLYLTSAVFSTWHGDVCTKADPEVWLEESRLYNAGQAILFRNTDTAWHSVPVSPARRIALTVSYMAESDWSNPNFQNQYTRAYFARRHGIQDGLDYLRRQRASEEEHEKVYRID
jgi:hypothetical protein